MFVTLYKIKLKSKCKNFGSISNNELIWLINNLALKYSCANHNFALICVNQLPRESGWGPLIDLICYTDYKKKPLM